MAESWRERAIVCMPSGNCIFSGHPCGEQNDGTCEIHDVDLRKTSAKPSQLSDDQGCCMWQSCTVMPAGTYGGPCTFENIERRGGEVRKRFSNACYSQTCGSMTLEGHSSRRAARESSMYIAMLPSVGVLKLLTDAISMPCMCACGRAIARIRVTGVRQDRVQHGAMRCNYTAAFPESKCWSSDLCAGSVAGRVGRAGETQDLPLGKHGLAVDWVQNLDAGLIRRHSSNVPV